MKFITNIILIVFLNTLIYSSILSDGEYIIKSKHSGSCLEFDTDDDIIIMQNRCKDKATQKFEFTNLYNDTFNISNFVLEQNSKSNGSHIYNGTILEEFNIEKKSNYYKIKINKNNKYVTAKPYTNELIQYNNHDGDEQLWIIINNSLEDDNIIEKNGITYNTVTSPRTGWVWLDKNLGASKICIQSDDLLCSGNYYQWGRNSDGHENENSNTSNISNKNINNTSSNFIIGKTYWTTDDSDHLERSLSWSKIDGTSVCPVNFRVPTYDEIYREFVSSDFKNTGDFTVIPAGGYRSNNGIVSWKGSYGYLVSSTTSHPNYNDGLVAPYITFYAKGKGYISNSTYKHSYGFQIRCIEH